VSIEIEWTGQGGLPASQKTLYEALRGRGDVSIEKLYSALGLAETTDSVRQQQTLGPYIVRLNRRLAKHRLAVKPGALKRTYALVVV